MGRLQGLEKVVITLNKWKGMFNRGAQEDCPPDHVIDLDGMFCRNGEFVTRPSIRKLSNFACDGPRTVFPVKQNIRDVNAAQRMYIVGTAAGGVFVLNTTTGPATTLILGPVGSWGSPGVMSCVQQGALVYASLWGSAEPVKVIDTTDPTAVTIRNLGGAMPPGPATIAVAIGGAGSIERGTHIYKVAFETASGFITKMSDANFNAFNSNGNEFHNLSGIPLGPAGTVARWIFTTKSIQRYNGDHMNAEYFFLPGGRIGDNVTTVLNNVQYYDADLVKSADYLLDQLETLFPCRNLSIYNNRLVASCVNDNGTIRADAMYISKAGEFESFDAVDGFIDTEPRTPGGIIDCMDYRGLLYIFKDGNTLATQDNDDVPSSWRVESVDTEKSPLMDKRFTTFDQFPGTPPQRLCKIIPEWHGEKSVIDDALVVACTDGLYTFKGAYQLELSYKIKAIWDQLFNDPTVTTYNEGRMINQFVVDVENKIMFFFAPANYSAVRTVIVADFMHGLNPEAIQWYKFTTPIATYSLSTVGKNYQNEPDMPLIFGLSDAGGFLFAAAKDQGGGDGIFQGVGVNTAIPQYLTFPRLFIEKNWMHHLNYMEFSMLDTNAVQWDVELLGDAGTVLQTPRLAVMANGVVANDKMVNFKARRIIARMKLPGVFPGNNLSNTRVIEVRFHLTKIWHVPYGL